MVSLTSYILKLVKPSSGYVKVQYFINCELKRFRRLEWHYKCRNDYYPGTDKKVKRWNIAEQEIKWIKKPFHPPYDPPTYTAKSVLDGPEWADPEMDGVWYESKPKWNLNVGGCYNRQCGVHVYLVNHSFPINPIGRTGLKGRGLLGRWGPNHAVHVIVARYKKIGDNFVINTKTRQPELEFISVKRADCGEWSVPGRFLRSREKLGLALKRCFIEECLNSLKSYAPKKRQKVLTIINKLFADGPLIYRGYVDDPRNTDNAWVSSTVFLFFDTASNITEKFDLEPGRNILEVKWLDADKTYKKTFYANHEDFVEDACRHVDAYYPISDSEERRLKKDYPAYDENSSLNVTDPEEKVSYSVSSFTSNIKP